MKLPFYAAALSALLAEVVQADGTRNLKKGGNGDNGLNCNRGIDQGQKGPTGFAYPKTMPRPPMMWIEGFASRLHAGPIQKYETPIQVYQTWRLDQAMWNCIAAYHPETLDALTNERPTFVADATNHNSEARALCMINAVNKLIPDLVPIAANDISQWLDDLCLGSSIMSNSDAIAMASSGDDSPRVLGSWVAAMILEDMKTDGFNYDGAMRYFEGEMVDCTANCRPFTDTTGYVPVNSPWAVTDDIRWQPLIESDDNGFFFAQEHVTPHIGTKAKPVVLTRHEIDTETQYELADPGADYPNMARDMDVINRVADLLGDDEDSKFQRDMVSFMDNKINIAGGMIMRLREEFKLSLEAQVFYHYGYTSVELDVVILAWKEKVRLDRIRPTSRVQKFFKNDDLTSFAGTHKGRDWVPFIRVMPHAEYPSGSGCICLGIAQYIDEFLQNEYPPRASIATTWEFPETGEFTFSDMSHLATICGESRLWGGMHYTEAVDDSYTLCDGVGNLGYSRLMVGLLGGATYAGLNSEPNEKFE